MVLFNYFRVLGRMCCAAESVRAKRRRCTVCKKSKAGAEGFSYTGSVVESGKKTWPSS